MRSSPSNPTGLRAHSGSSARACALREAHWGGDGALPTADYISHRPLRLGSFRLPRWCRLREVSCWRALRKWARGWPGIAGGGAGAVRASEWTRLQWLEFVTERWAPWSFLFPLQGRTYPEAQNGCELSVWTPSEGPQQKRRRFQKNNLQIPEPHLNQSSLPRKLPWTRRQIPVQAFVFWPFFHTGKGQLSPRILVCSLGFCVLDGGSKCGSGVCVRS